MLQRVARSSSLCETCRLSENLQATALRQDMGNSTCDLSQALTICFDMKWFRRAHKTQLYETSRYVFLGNREIMTVWIVKWKRESAVVLGFYRESYQRAKKIGRICMPLLVFRDHRSDAEGNIGWNIYHFLQRNKNSRVVKGPWILRKRQSRTQANMMLFLFLAHQPF
jgi:hypothetical protein